MNVLTRLSHLGIDASTPFTLKNKLRVFNNANIVIFFISVFYCSIGILNHFLWAAVVTFYSILSTLFAFYLIHKRKTKLAFHYMMWYGFIFLSLFSYLFGNSNNSYYYFLFMPVACNIFFDELKVILLYVAMSASLMILNVFYVEHYEPYYVQQAWMPFFSYPNILFAVLLIFVGVRLFKTENLKYAAQIEEQRKALEEKNTEITDSITYAKRLQEAILPAIGSIKKYLPETFILYRPKDIVAGDFYWMEHIEGVTYIAAADSTGHGVPGAMVSVVCHNALNRALNEFGLREPGEILDKTREIVIETFSKSGDEVKDGMDISLISIRHSNSEKTTIKWAGANNPLWFINGGNLQQIKAHKQPVGVTLHPTPFPTHELNLMKDDLLFLITDGFADQFGGKDGKKFKQKQLQQLLTDIKSNPLEEQKEKLEQAFDLWKGITDQIDDVTVIGIKL